MLESVTQIPDGHDSTATSKESAKEAAAASPDTGGGGGGASVGSPGTESTDELL